MKTGWIFLALGLFIFASQITGCVRGNYEFENRFLANWSLADKASTIAQKTEYIDKFVFTLEHEKDLAGSYNAIWLKTPDNSFDMNLHALKSLQLRLQEIKNMNPASFEYQTAIQQITAQEQGEANAVISTVKGCWYLENHALLWGWISILINALAFVLMCFGFFIVGEIVSED